MTKEMRPAVWFSRHEPTAEQLAEIGRRGYELVDVPAGMKLGGMAINSHDDLAVVETGLRGLCQASGSRVVFGVFPTPLMALMLACAEAAVNRGDWHAGDISCYAAWNVSRSVDGGKPTFSHLKFETVGVL